MNPMPPTKSDTDLADDFTNFLKNKILTTRNLFTGIPQYESTPVDVPKFSQMSEKQVELIVKSMMTKSCEQNSILSDILKSMLPAVLPAIMRTVNLSLSEGLFHASWKTATVKPLLKKLGLQLTKTNYRAVSNLKFLSKLIEKCLWSGLVSTVLTITCNLITNQLMENSFM